LFRTRSRGLLLIVLLILVEALIVALAFLEHDLMYIMTFLLVQIVHLLFLIDLAVAAAGAVTKEREARTWPILLMTPLENGQIIKGKVIGVLRRNLPLLAPLPVLYLLMLIGGPADRGAPQYVAVGVGLLLVTLVSTTFFLLGTGVYFSTRLKTTTAAVMATFAAYVVPKFFFCGFLSPLFAVTTGIRFAFGRNVHSASVPLTALIVAVAPALVYTGMGLLFMRLAVGRVRRNIF